MFNLTLGNAVRRNLLERYSDVHKTRRYIQTFAESWNHLMSPHSRAAKPLWDGVSEGAVPHQPWVSKHLGEDEDLETLLGAWADDNGALQNWLWEYERTTTLANNWGQHENRVFSEEVATQVMLFGKVRPSGG
jgi:hypothetical protein